MTVPLLIGCFVLMGLVCMPRVHGTGDGDRDGRAYQSPVWNPGDWWAYDTRSEEETSMTLQGLNVNIEETTEHRVEIVRQIEIVNVNGSQFDVYNVTFESDEMQSGTWSYASNNGDFFIESHSVGHTYYRTSDLAFIKQDLEVNGQYNFVGLTSSPFQGNSVTTATPPLNNFEFPMAPADLWAVNSWVVTDITMVQQGDTTQETIYEHYDYINTVGLEDSTNVAGVSVDFYPIHGFGTVTAQGMSGPVNMFNNYSAQVKNSINNLTDFGDIDKQLSQNVDLAITVSDISISPSSPREGMPIRLFYEFSNLGEDPVIGPEVEVFIVGGDILNSTRYYMILGGGIVENTLDIGILEPGGYQVRVSLDSDNSISETNEGNNQATLAFTVSENRAPVISGYEPLFDPTINEGTSIDFIVNATDPDADTFSYQWFIDDVIVDGEDQRRYKKDFTGAIPGSVHLVKVVLTDELDANTNHTWEVTINAPPTITEHFPSTETVTINETEEVQFHIVVEDAGDEAFIFQWYVDGYLVPSVKSAFFSFISAYEGDNSSEDSPYEIMVIVEDLLDLSSEFKWTLVVNDLNQAPSILTAMVGGERKESITINEKEFLEFNVTANDPDRDDLAYLWFVDGIEVEGAATEKYTFNTDHDTVGHDEGSSSREFNITVMVRDAEYNDTYVWELTVMDKNRPMKFTVNTPSESDLLELIETDRVDFNVTGTDNDGDVVQCQWYLDGVPLTVDLGFNYSFTPGNHTIKLVASDGYGSDHIEYINFTVLPKESDNDGVGTDTPDNDGDLPVLLIIVVIIVIILVIGTIYLLIRRKGSKENVSFVMEPRGSSEDEIFKCPKCNEKADEDLGYCIDCGATFDQ